MTVAGTGADAVCEAGGALDAEYWRGSREDDAPGDVEALAALGVDVVIEIGPRLGSATGYGDALVLTAAEAATDTGADAFAVTVARAYEAGLDVSLRGLFAGEERRRVSLPGYPFQRRKHWIVI